jgi:hypothetical protein
MHACDLDHQALGCACGDETRAVLEQIMLWNGKHRRDNKEIPGEFKSFKQVEHTSWEQDAHEQRMAVYLLFLLRPCLL